MKGNNGDGNTKDRDIWETPQLLFDKLNRQYDFTFDCCAEEENSKCETFSSDFLDLEELGNVTSWMNPPFSKASEMFEHFFKVVKRGVCIYRCDNMETKIWQDIILKNASWVSIPKGRIRYEGMEGKGSRFPSALIGFNVPEPIGVDGTTLFTSKENKK